MPYTFKRYYGMWSILGDVIGRFMVNAINTQNIAITTLVFSTCYHKRYGVLLTFLRLHNLFHLDL